MRADRFTPALLTAVQADYEAGANELDLLARYPMLTVGMIRGKAMRLQWHRPASGRAKVLTAGSPALVEARPLFPGQVRGVDEVADVLPSGRWQRKLGERVEKGAWRGMPIFSLTLAERSTCPAYCPSWRGCMGNGMQFAVRIRRGPELEDALAVRLAALQRANGSGFVVRLHILGDFYSAAYVERWRAWLDEFPALHVFGYSAWRPRGSAIGEAVAALRRRRWDRFAVRWSTDKPGPTRAITIDDWPAGGTAAEQRSARAAWRDRGVIVCPAETGATRGCASCGLCWSPSARDVTIGFIAHGGKRLGGAA